MTSFDFLWQLFERHGVIERHKVEAAQLWDTFILEQQRTIYRSIRDKIQAGKFVNYNPVLAIKENAPKCKPPQILSFNDYYKLFSTTEEKDGWKMANPTGQKVIYVKN